MARNVEIKARIESVESLIPRVAPLADSGPTTFQQDDMFFPCPNGRLKLRKRSETGGELIFYLRENCAEPKESFYVLAPTTAPDALREALVLGYGVIGQVRKTRTLFMVGRTRIHLDSVEGLGEFLELEVMLAENEPVDVGQRIARELLDKLGVSTERLVPGAYIDLLDTREKAYAQRSR